ncbi:unnamed protein product [Nippostrongylus brasiliensis]|uniref:glucuronosyltransferase n=1 Tax=Nippostrongylus brasiliensis TaxID=27835 RepID=A0A0N4YLZ3_NIPBR|nr:unnamed protein product [Nippostrongylus brasiliensis]
MFATGIVQSNYDLGTPQKLRESLERNNDDSFTENATRLSEMLLTSPTTAKQLLITNSEFAAKFGRLPNLDPYGRQLSFVEYFLLDVFLTIIAIMYSCCCGCHDYDLQKVHVIDQGEDEERLNNI